MRKVVVTGAESKESLFHHRCLDIIVLQNHVLLQGLDGVVFLGLDLLGQQDLQRGQRSGCNTNWLKVMKNMLTKCTR